MVAQYSNYGRTVVLYAFSLSCPEHLRIALLRKPNILLAALLMLSICWFHRSLLFIVKPRYGALFTLLICSPFIE